MKLIFVGDVMMGRGVSTALKLNGLDHVFGGVRALFTPCDGIVANLETPFTRGGRPFKNKDPHLCFRIAPEMVVALNYIGISGVTIANNHSTDYGRQGIEETRDVLKKNKIKSTGAGRNLAEAVEPITFINKSNSIGLFGFNAFVPFTTSAGKSTFGVARFDKKTIDYAFKQYGHEVDGFIIAVHWGIDYSPHPIPQLVQFAIRLLDEYEKIIAIVGYHPHLQQPIIYHKRKPIILSLGNFIFDEPFPLSRIGSVLSLEIDNNMITNHNYSYTILNEENQLVPLSNHKIQEEEHRLDQIARDIGVNASQYRTIDRRWIKYLIRHTLSNGSLDGLCYMLSIYSIPEILRKSLGR